MSLKTVRFLFAIIFLIIVLSKQFQILYYFPVMFLSLEFLNRNKQYRTLYNYKLLNSIFICYVLFIVINRGRPFSFYPAIELIINSVEHLLFGFVICLKTAVYYCIFRQTKFLTRNELISIAFLFNIFGFINEFFQNWYKNQTIWKLSFDSGKDILMNITGTILFILLYQLINNRIRPKNTLFLK